jgi:hypothetical protein
MRTLGAGSVVVVALLAWGCLGSARGAEVGRGVPPTTRVAGGSGGLSGNPATGLQLSLCTPAQIFPADYDVSGFRFNLIYGRNSNLRGFDLGMVNHVTGLVEGFQLGLGNRAGELSGLQMGVFNSFEASEAGCCQIGLINMGRDVTGVQIGLFNYCDTISGVQIGLLNFITQSDFVIFCPIINAQF